jgi:hypothetical protein
VSGDFHMAADGFDSAKKICGYAYQSNFWKSCACGFGHFFS